MAKKSDCEKFLLLNKGEQLEALPALMEECGFTDYYINASKDLQPHFEFNSFKKGEVIFEESSDSDDYFIILEGHVKLVSYNHVGREILFRKRGAASMFGLLSAIDGKPRESSAISMSSGVYGKVSGKVFKDFYNNDANYAKGNAHALIREIRKLYQRVFDYNQYTTRERVAIEILRLAHFKISKGYRLSEFTIQPHSHIASTIDGARETVTRTIKSFVEMGVLEKIDRKTYIKDLTALEEEAHLFAKKDARVESHYISNYVKNNEE